MQDWEQLRTEHGRAIWSIISRIVRNEADAMDCYQEVFSEAFRKSRTGEVNNVPGLLRWLAVRRSIDLQRRKKAEPQFEPISNASVVSGPTKVEGCIAFSEMVERIRDELQSIPPNQAEAFWLCCVEQMTYSEAASAMRLNADHVGVLVHRARKHLQRKLAHWNDCPDAKQSNSGSRTRGQR